jgi:hypothetical protein
MAWRRFPYLTAGLTLAMILFSSIVNLANALTVLDPWTIWFNYGELTWERDTAVLPTGLSSDSLAYLENDFCRDGLCPAGAWQRWIIVDESSTWTVAHLEMLHKSLWETMSALETVGLDGRSLLAGYRFRHQSGERIHGWENSIALVRHEAQEIILTDNAFSTEDGFSIYHELGHVADHRLKRQLTTTFMAVVGGGEEYKRQTGHLLPDGYWVRTQTSLNPYEATADAFAVWVTVGYLQRPHPTFYTMPDDVNFESISWAVDLALQEAAKTRAPLWQFAVKIAPDHHVQHKELRQ